MSDSQFEDLGASNIKNDKLLLEVKMKERMIHQLNDKLSALQKQLMAMQSCQLASQAQLQKKNTLLKQMVVDNTRLTKKLSNQEIELIKLRQELLSTDKSLHESLSSNLVEKESLVKLNQELSEGLMRAEQILASNLEELRSMRLKIDEKDQSIKQLDLKLKILQAQKSQLQNLTKKFQESQPTYLKAVSDMQEKLNTEKRKSTNLTKEINQLNQTIIELQQRHLQKVIELNKQLSMERQSVDEVKKEKNLLMAELIDLRQKRMQIQQLRNELTEAIKKQKVEISQLEINSISLTQQTINLSTKKMEPKRQQSSLSLHKEKSQVSEQTIKQLELKFKVSQNSIHLLEQTLSYACQQSETLRGEIKKVKQTNDKLTLQCVELKSSKEGLQKEVQKLNLTNHQLIVINQQLAHSMQQFHKQLVTTRKQLSLHQLQNAKMHQSFQEFSAKTIRDQNDRCTDEFILLKIKELVLDIEGQVNEFDLKQQQKKEAVKIYKQKLFRSIQEIFQPVKSQELIEHKIKQNNNKMKSEKSTQLRANGFKQFS